MSKLPLTASQRHSFRCCPSMRRLESNVTFLRDGRQHRFISRRAAGFPMFLRLLVQFLAGQAAHARVRPPVRKRFPQWLVSSRGLSTIVDHNLLSIMSAAIIKRPDVDRTAVTITSAMPAAMIPAMPASRAAPAETPAPSISAPVPTRALPTIWIEAIISAAEIKLDLL
jgi:hypothetical protein